MVTKFFWSSTIWQLNPFWLQMTLVFNCWQPNFQSPLVATYRAQWELSKKLVTKKIVVGDQKNSMTNIKATKTIFQAWTIVVFNHWWVTFWLLLVAMHRTQWKISKNILHALSPNLDGDQKWVLFTNNGGIETNFQSPTTSYFYCWQPNFESPFM